MNVARIADAKTFASKAEEVARRLEALANPRRLMILSTDLDHSTPIDLQRQVQIATGLMVLVGVALGLAVSPWFFALSAFVGVGLTVAGITGFCGMARLLTVMPWNYRLFANVR